MDVLAVQTRVAPLPLPQVAISVRAGTVDDIPFMDELQKKHTKQVGWMPTKQFEGKVAAGHVLVAVAGGQWPVASESGLATSHKPLATTPVGYLIGNDQYFKRDDVGIIYQVNVAPVAQRGLIGATLLKAQFERSAWGCKLYCCWCAQDIAANHFWKAMGFVPLAFRTGSAKKDRVHIFWQKRIRAEDEETPWWFPSQTSGGSIRSDRIVLPIPPGKQWDDEMPRILPALSGVEGPSPRKRKPKAAPVAPPPEPVKQPFRQMLGGWGAVREVASPVPTPAPVAVVEAVSVEVGPVEKPLKKKQAKNDPKLVAAARELRDRWLEAVNRGEFVALPEAKYEVARVIEDRTAQTQSAIGNGQSAIQRAPTLPSPAPLRSTGEGSKIALLPAA